MPRDVIISIESRKGGVGKTTVALNTAKVLMRPPFDCATLVLDLDMTGTNICDEVVTSAYWQGRVKSVVRGKDRNAADLLKVFLDDYMWPETEGHVSVEPGQSIGAALGFQKNAINVLGSSFPCPKLAGDPYSAENSPGLLFDQLHAFWLREFVKEVITGFRAYVRQEYGAEKRTCVILDNSPGYVGLEPWIHDWITDLGPELAKVIHVASLDAQDVIASASGLLGIWRLACRKREVSKLYRELSESDAHDRAKPFDDFEKRRLGMLAAADSEDETQAESSALAYHLRADFSKGGDFTPESFMGLVLNRVPDEALEPGARYDFAGLPYNEDAKSAEAEVTQGVGDGASSELGSRDVFLRLAGDNPLETLAVRFSPLIAAQFVGEHLQVAHPVRERELSEVAVAIRNLSGRLDTMSQRDWLGDPQSMDATIHNCFEVGGSLEDILRRLPDKRFGKAFSSSFFPSHLGTKAASVRRAMRLPAPKEGSPEPGVVGPLFEQLLGSVRNISASFLVGIEPALDIRDEQLEALLRNCIGSLAFCMPEEVWHGMTEAGREMTWRIGAMVVWRQATAFDRNSGSQRAVYARQPSGQFYAAEARNRYHVRAAYKQTWRELREHWLRDIADAQFDATYSALCAFEARFVDLAADTRLLLEAGARLPDRLSGMPGNAGPIFASLKDSLTAVVVEKKALHEDWDKLLTKGMQASVTMQAMEDVIEPILKQWMGHG